MPYTSGGTFNGGAVTGATSFLDGANFQVKNTADPSKIVQFDVSGLTTGNTATPFTFSGTAAAPAVIFANGAAATPSARFTTDQSGFWQRASGVTDVTIAGSHIIEFANGASNAGTGIIAGSAQAIGWFSAAAPAGVGDTVLTRESAAVFQAGLDVNGAPINQTFKAHDGITGTDILGASLTLAPGKGTGAAVSGGVIINRDLVKATGTTAQTYGQAIVAAPSKILSNTSATAQTVATVTTTTLTGGGCTWFYNVHAESGTAADSDTGCINISWENVGGTAAAAAGVVISAIQSDSSGTLATTPTVTVATNVVSIKVTPTWVTIVPTTVTYSGTFMVHGVDSVVPV